MAPVAASGLALDHQVSDCHGTGRPGRAADGVQMETKRLFNFSPGPATLPPEVLEASARALVDYRGMGAGVAELSHRGPEFDEILDETMARCRSLLGIPADVTTALGFGARALEQGSLAWNARFREEAAPAMLTGVAAHTILPQPSIAAAGAGLAHHLALDAV